MNTKLPTVDLSALSTAPNFYTFCVGEEFLNTKPWVEQAIIGTKFNGDYCPHCSDNDWLQQDSHIGETLIDFEKHVKLLHYGKCFRCGCISAMTSNMAPNFETLAFVAGMRGGKDSLIAWLAAYVAHNAIMSEDLKSSLGVLPTTLFHISLISRTRNSAQEISYSYLYDVLKHSPWFKELHSLLDAVETEDKELYQCNDAFSLYQFNGTNLRIEPCGATKREIRGRTRLFAAADMSWWPSDEEIAHSYKQKYTDMRAQRDGECIQPGVLEEAESNCILTCVELNEAIARSLLTVQKKANAPLAFGKCVLYSTPQYDDDYVLNYKIYDSVLYAKKTTTQMNPYSDTANEITHQSVVDPVPYERDYNVNPYERDYNVNPPSRPETKHNNAESDVKKLMELTIPNGQTQKLVNVAINSVSITDATVTSVNCAVNINQGATVTVTLQYYIQ